MKVLSVSERYNSATRRRYLWSVIALYALYLFVSFPFMLVAYVACTMQILKLSQYMTWMRQGLTGEEQVGEMLAKLSGFVRSAEVYEVNDERFEVDYIFVNHAGIFAIEVKTFRGSLLANSEDNEWIQLKQTRRKRTVTNRISNPLPITKSKAARLRQVLDQVDIARHKKFITPLVVVIAEQADVHGSNVLTVSDLELYFQSKKRRLNLEEQRELFMAISKWIV